jgi:hypothetical protein
MPQRQVFACDDSSAVRAAQQKLEEALSSSD